jgi:DNA end-binding protein Ku
MAARSIASLTISFGMVSIPVKVYSATEASKGIHFNLLHKGCGSRLKQQYLCIKEEIPVARDDMVKGYEFAKDQYVMFTPEELKALEEAGTHSADITEFVPLKTIDPVYFDKAYYLGPDKGGSKAYFLLSETLKRTGRVALAKYAARGKQYLVMLRPKDGGLVMQQLLYADEIRPISEIGLDREPVQDAELKLATMLVEQRATDRFRPETYEDEVKKRIQAQLKRKIETGEEISSAPSPESGEVIDLMEALRRSLGKPSSGSRKSGPVTVAERKPARRAVRGAGEKKAAARK